MIRRRDFLVTGATALAIGSGSGAAQQSATSRSSAACHAGQSGCDQSNASQRARIDVLEEMGLEELGETVDAELSTTHSPWLDRTIARYAFDIHNHIGMSLQPAPALFYYDDSEQPGAKYYNVALKDPRLPKCYGVIVIGKTLVDNLLSVSQNDDAAIRGIMSHEMAHARLFKSGAMRVLLDRWPDRPSRSTQVSELLADYMAGWTWGQFGIENDFSLDRHFIETTGQAGDNFYNCSQHHGTSEQRTSALIAGFARRRELLNLSEALPLIERL